MTLEEASGLAQRLTHLGWDTYVQSWNVWATRCYVLAYHATLGSHRMDTPASAALWIARTRDAELSEG